MHTVKGFQVVSEAEIDVFLEFPCFFYDPKDVDNLVSGSCDFLYASWTSGTSQFTYCWSLAWRILSIILLACEMSAIVQSFEHALQLPLFGIWMKTDIFQHFGHCWVFQICWHMECNTFRASSFSTWHSSAGIPSPPLAFFTIMHWYCYMCIFSPLRWDIVVQLLNQVWLFAMSWTAAC